MKKIVCYSRESAPAQFDENTLYFELFMRTENQESGIGIIGLPLQYELRRFGIVPSIPALDFAAFAFSVVTADKAISRTDSVDGWTRMIDLSVSLNETEKWNPCKEKIEKMLRFLTGDFWTLTFMHTNTPLLEFNYTPIERTSNCICLLSGGVDSLVGAVDLVFENISPIFVSQIVRGDKKRQKHFANSLGIQNHCQWSVGKLPSREGSTRGRSITFFAFAALASCMLPADKRTQIVVPENGFISLNIPLTTNRIGSLSTKTTHPVYMIMIQELWNTLGINADLVLPYQFKTKGEIIKECKDQELLSQLLAESVSCGKFQRHKLQHCGVCVPCLIRRAAFLEAGLHDRTIKGYAFNSLKHSNSQDIAAAAMAVRQVELHGVERFVKSNLSFADNGERSIFLGVISRGITELGNLLRSYDVI